MKTKFLFLVTLIVCYGCKAQDGFVEFVQNFQEISLPLESFDFFSDRDTLSAAVFNHYFWDAQPKFSDGGKTRTVLPKVYKDGILVDLAGFGRADETPTNYRSVNGEKGKFYSKIYPVARIDLHENFVSIIIKEYRSELAHYDLYTFSKEGVRLSAVPLFTYVHKQMLVDKVDSIIIQSIIKKDGSIEWTENNRGLKTNRIYQLKDDGYFEIVLEERTGEFEY